MKKKKILFVTPYPFDSAPSQRLKFEQYFPAFEQYGFTWHQSPFINKRFWKIIYQKGNVFLKILYSIAAYFRRLALLFTLRKYDVVYIHLWVTPFGPPIFEWLYTKIAKKTIYDIDDLIYLHTDRTYNNITGLIKGRSKPVFLMKNTDHVITCTPYLDQFVRKYNQQTTDISSTINTVCYVPVNKYHNDHEIILGWSGSHSTSKYLKLLAPVLNDLAKKYSFKLLVMGDPLVAMEGVNVEAIPWTAASEIKNLQRIDIGLYPLPDEQWVYGKSGLKALQYMALGIPTVATAIGANFRIIENNVSGFLVQKEQEWIDVLGKLIGDPILRQRIGQAGRKMVVEHFSIEANAPVYINILETLTR